MRELVKLQETLDQVLDYLTGNDIGLVMENLRNNIDTSKSIVENLLIQRVVVPKGALCECEYPIIRQDLTEYCSICQKEVK